MNRYSLFFAVLVAASFGVRSNHAGDQAASPGSANKYATKRHTNPLTDEPVAFIQRFLCQVGPCEPRPGVQILFASVPHPVETHLSAAFDQNLEALQDGLQDAGYLFDSSRIPWSSHAPRDRFDDDAKEKDAQDKEDSTPGILLFRKHDDPHPQSSYRDGVIVFLISEQPTQGVAIPQVKTAVDVINAIPTIHYSGPVRILGPSYSGSMPSMVPMLRLLHEANGNSRVILRSGGVSGGRDARAALKEISRQFPELYVDFGSTTHDNSDSIQAALLTLNRIGVDSLHIATLSEGESAYGVSIRKESDKKSGTRKRSGGAESGEEAVQEAGKANDNEGGDESEKNDEGEGLAPAYWKVTYPRDISTLRAGYEKQGILDGISPSQPWNRALDLKNDEQNEGDSIRHYGGTSTEADQEAVLFGISEFLRAHSIRAVILSATNEEDLYFLTQFLHAHNSDLRVMVMGAKRIFMRGSTAQFRGDMIVGDFPMLPRLHEWTGNPDDFDAHVFADDGAEGTYFAAIDLFPRTDRSQDWYAEYSAPNWDENRPPVQRPPMYVAALGSNSTWPVAEFPGQPRFGTPCSTEKAKPCDKWRVEMPFTLFKHDDSVTTEAQNNRDRPRIPVGRSWVDVFLILIALTVIYCSFFWYAKPVMRVGFASFEPSMQWPFWLFKVAIPGAVAASAFLVMAWAVALPVIASPWSGLAWWLAEAMALLAPFSIAISAFTKALYLGLPSAKRSEVPAMSEAAPAAEFKSGEEEATERTISLPERLARMKIEFRHFQVHFRALLWISFLPSLLALAATIYESVVYLQFPDRSVAAILNTYREMHGESGLSLVPTVLLFLLAILVWATRAGDGSALFDAAPILPEDEYYSRVSQTRAKVIVSIGRPLPFNKDARWFWILWGFVVAIIATEHFLQPLSEITSLEGYWTTFWIRAISAGIVALICLDVLQFLWLWDGLHGFLHALNSQEFKRSFVPIQDFKWRNLWSFTGISLRDRRAILGAQVHCVLNLTRLERPAGVSGDEAAFIDVQSNLENLLKKYSRTNIGGISSIAFRKDLDDVYSEVALAGTAATRLVRNLGIRAMTSTDKDGEWSSSARPCPADEKRFSDETDALSKVSEWQQTAEKLICLIYIGFIQTVVARLHTLLVSVALMFSLVTLGIAIYPFAPITPFLLAGLILLLLIAWAFFKVFSEMDTDPILARIVNGDDSKLQGSFYAKFAEAIALPLLTLASSMLPGGAGRLLELVQTLFNHGQ